AACPAGTAPLGGGGASSSFDLAVNINSSFPPDTLDSWRLDENNASGSFTTFQAFAVCGVLKGYTVVKDDEFLNLAGMQNFQITDCPASTVPVGGGVLSHASDVRVNLNATDPDGLNWESFVNNGAPFDTSYTPYA